MHNSWLNHDVVWVESSGFGAISSCRGKSIISYM
jgi:hypothetical protein